MSREWKPGDVANTLVNGTQHAFRTHEGWTYIDGSTGDATADHYGFRPLVVIDPEDRKAAVDIAQKAASAAGVDPGVDIGAVINAVQAALREFANPTPPKPPKPDEPTGLGAVIEDAAGTRWVRTEGPPARITGCVWTSAFSTALPDRAVNRAWDDIAAVRVLSEGVPS